MRIRRERNKRGPDAFSERFGPYNAPMTQTLKPAAASSIENVPLLSGGKWSTSNSARHGDVYNPSTGQVIARVPFCSTDEVNRVIETAHAALPAWANKPVVERCRYLFKFRDLIVQHGEEIARTVTREHGKTLAEARAS